MRRSFVLLAVPVGCICIFVAYKLGTTRKQEDILVFVPGIAGTKVEGGRIISLEPFPHAFYAQIQEEENKLVCRKVFVRVGHEDVPYWVPSAMVADLQPEQDVVLMLNGFHSTHYTPLAEVI